MQQDMRGNCFDLQADIENLGMRVKL